jgi:hypothetical protein
MGAAWTVQGAGGEAAHGSVVGCRRWRCLARRSRVAMIRAGGHQVAGTGCSSRYQSNTRALLRPHQRAQWGRAPPHGAPENCAPVQTERECSENGSCVDRRQPRKSRCLHDFLLDSAQVDTEIWLLAQAGGMAPEGLGLTGVGQTSTLARGPLAGCRAPADQGDMRQQWTSNLLQQVELGDETTPSDQVVMSRVRTRLATHGLRLRLHARDGGWRWAIGENSHRLSPVFGSLHQALYHADAHTAARYPE